MRCARTLCVHSVVNQRYSSSLKWLTTALLSATLEVMPLRGYDEGQKVDPKLLELLFSQNTLSKAEIRSGGVALKKRVQRYLSGPNFESNQKSRTIATQCEAMPSKTPTKSIGIQCGGFEEDSSNSSVSISRTVEMSVPCPREEKEKNIGNPVKVLNPNRSALETLYDMDLL